MRCVRTTLLGTTVRRHAQQFNFFPYFQFDLWTDAQRKQFLAAIFKRCRRSQLVFTQRYFDGHVPLKHSDFTKVTRNNKFHPPPSFPSCFCSRKEHFCEFFPLYPLASRKYVPGFLVQFHECIFSPLSQLFVCRRLQPWTERVFFNFDWSAADDLSSSFDFQVMPRCLSLHIMSFLDPRSLSRASMVSWHWKFLAEQVREFYIEKNSCSLWKFKRNRSKNKFANFVHFTCPESACFFPDSKSRLSQRKHLNYQIYVPVQLIFLVFLVFLSACKTSVYLFLL